MRHKSVLASLVAVLLFGCGSGGGATSSTEIKEELVNANLGMMRGDQPTFVRVGVAKPFYHEGTVELAEPPTGPFAPAAGTLPAQVEAGQDAAIWLNFTPPAGSAAAYEGTIRLRFRRAGSSSAYPVTLLLRAEVESPSAQVLATQASAGDVIVGETSDFGVYVENTSKVTPIMVTDVTAPDGDFSIAPDATSLPTPVGAGARLFVRLRYSPQSLGSAGSSIRIFHSASAVPLEVALTGAGVEQPSARLLETELHAGNVVLGESVELGVDFENTSAGTAVTVTGVTLPAGEFSLAPEFTLPAAVAAGATLRIPVVYAPMGEWDASTTVQVHHSADAAPLEATLTGTGIAPRVYFGFDVALDPNTSESDWITVEVPAEAVSLFIEATGEPWSLIDLVEMKGPGDTVYEYYGSGPLDWASYYPAGGLGYLNIELPNTEAPEVQLVPGGGTYSFRLRDSYYAASSLNVRVTVSQRTAATVESGTLNVRIFLADGLGIYSNPMADAKLAEVVETIDAVLGMNGIRLGDVSFAWMDPYYDTMWDSWMTEEMFSVNTASYPEDALNLFLVADMSWWGIAGIAGAAPGPAANGTIYSGVAVDFNVSDGITVGLIAAHEVGHYLGHFPLASEGVLLEQTEAYPVLRHPLLNPGLPASFFSPDETTDVSGILAAIDQMGPMDSWCGTGTRGPVR